MILELFHTNVCGPSRKRSPRGEEYFILFIDDFSRMCWIGLMKHKDEAFDKFKAFKALVENESDQRIKCLRSDRGGEFTSDEFFDFCEEHRIRREFSTARTPQQNGVVERRTERFNKWLVLCLMSLELPQPSGVKPHLLQLLFSKDKDPSEKHSNSS